MNFSTSSHNIEPNILYFESLNSTNDYAKSLISYNKVPDFTIIHTSNQLAGRGQRGNEWISGEGLNLTASWIHYPHLLKVERAFDLSMWTALAVYDALSAYLPYHHSIKIKWPNDIYVNDQKIAGILIENNIEKDFIAATVIGIGINVNQQEFLSIINATSIYNQIQSPKDLNEILLAVHQSLIQKVGLLKHIGLLKTMYLKHLYRFNEMHYFKTDSETIYAKIIDCDEQGKLMLQKADHELLKFDIKEIKFLINPS
jgi:BirA family transcriptional regulator, biotin operon repressor / biotin---[acetyl-CoA-carboxylase] ligase